MYLKVHSVHTICVYVIFIQLFSCLYEDIIHEIIASGLSHVQADKPWCNYFIPFSSVYTLLSMKYFVLKFAFSGKGEIIYKIRCTYTYNMCICYIVELVSPFCAFSRNV